MAKLRPGDRFFVTQNSAAGTVRRMGFNSVIQAEEYIVEWDHLLTQYYSYEVDDADFMWTFAGHNVVAGNSADTMFTVQIGEHQEPACEHVFQDYQGFREFFKFCVKCDHKEHQ